MPVYESPKTETGINEDKIIPARLSLHTLDALCNSEVAKDVEHETTFPQNGIAFPSCAWHCCVNGVTPEGSRSQVGDRPRGASSGDSTSAGAENSQRTHRLQATDDDGKASLRSAETYYPSLCCAPSESSIGFK